MIIRLLTLGFFLALSLNSFGQCRYAIKNAYRPISDTSSEALVLSLDEAKAYALEHSLDLQQSKNNVLKAVYAKRQSIGSYIPQINASIDFNTYFNKSITSEMGLMPITLEMPNTSNFSAQASQLVFNASAIVGIMMGKIAQNMAELNEENASRNLSRSISLAYISVLIAQENKTIVKESLSILQDLMNKTNDMVLAGVMEQTDAEQLQVRVNLLENSLKNIERAVELASNALKLSLGMEIDRELILSDNLDAILSQENDLVLLNSTYDMELDPSYRLVDQNLNLAKKQSMLSAAASLPSLAVFYQYTHQILKPKFSMQPEHVAGLALSVPIFTGLANTNKYKQSRIDLFNAELQKQTVQRQLSLQEKQLRFNLTTALEQYDTQKLNVEVSQRVFNSIKLKYEQGLRSSMDLTNANSDFIQAQSDYLNSISQMLQARFDLEQLLNK